MSDTPKMDAFDIMFTAKIQIRALERENKELLERITALEAKCALLAASWKKAEDELEKMRGFAEK
jgi:hypothetical protein